MGGSLQGVETRTAAGETRLNLKNKKLERTNKSIRLRDPGQWHRRTFMRIKNRAAWARRHHYEKGQGGIQHKLRPGRHCRGDEQGGFLRNARA